MNGHARRLTRKLATVIPPFCTACKYGKQTKHPRCTKGPHHHLRTTTPTGQVVSVDQLESTTSGFIAQLKGQLTTQRNNYATIFVNQLSKLSFVFLQKWLTSAETILTKQSFEHFVRDLGVKNIHYHAHNGRFADNGFIQACKDNNPGLTYCGVNAHFQNGMAEKRIRDLQEQATKCSCSQCISGLACFHRPYGCMHYEQPMKCEMQHPLRVK